MQQYISKSAIIAEIERIKKEECSIDTYEGRCKLFYFEQFLSFLNTLDVKEVEKFIWNNARTTVPEDSTNQIICIKEDGLAVSTIGKIVNGTVKWAYLDDLLNTNSFNVEVKEVDLDKEFDKYCANLYLSDLENEPYAELFECAKHFFEFGLKAQKGE